MKSPLLIAISLLFLSHYCFSQTQVVWPGDVNNNGIVNEVDLLYLGFAFGEMGAARTEISTEWIGQEATEWIDTFPNGLNFVFADCNGDGIVDENDADVIEINLNNIHDDVPFVMDETLDAIPEIDPQFAFLPDTFLTNQGEFGEIQISLGSNEQQLSDILGVAFTINYEPRFFQANSFQFDFLGDAWIIPFDSETIPLILENPEEGKITVVSTVTDGISVSGGGFIGTVSFIIQDDIVDFLIAEDTIKIDIDSITIVTDDLERVPVVGATSIIEIEGRTTSTYNPILDRIKYYPNPNNGWVLLQTNDIKVEKVEVVNALGQAVYQKELNRSRFHSLDLQQLPKGIHWLRIITEQGIRSVPIERLE